MYRHFGRFDSSCKSVNRHKKQEQADMRAVSAYNGRSCAFPHQHACGSSRHVYVVAHMRRTPGSKSDGS